MINITDNNKSICCGCTACACVCPKHCITMQEDKEGFKYPSVDKANCINCGLCEKVCPVINNPKPKTIPKEAYITRNNDSDIVKTSTSGGTVSALCDQIISEDGIIFGGAFDDNFNVKHTSAETKDELTKFRSSKYVQSDLENTFVKIKKELDSSRLVMFTGTPCQTAGLHNYLRKPYENLIIVDFVCRAVPSPLVWEMHRKELSKKYKSKLVYANFREKTYGYHSANLTMRFANNKKSVENTKTDNMLKSFFSGICSRPSCYSCPFRSAGRVSDLTVFDCWNVTRYVPTLPDDDKGYTAVMIQSAKGKKIFESISDKITKYDADINLLLQTDGKMALQNPKMHPKRKEYFEMLESGAALSKAVKTYIPIKFSRRLAGKTRTILYKTNLLNKLKNLKSKG
jgi:coenzyme F420-reducing hydrogenase beta subunit